MSGWFNWTHLVAALIGLGAGILVTSALYGMDSAFSLAGAIAVGTLVNACIVTYIGFRQYKTSLATKELGEAKHRADLFDRRFAVFQATQKVLSKVFRDAACDYRDVHEFTPWTQQAYFLFDDSVYKYVLEVRTHLIEMTSTTRLMKDNSERENRQQIIDKNYAALVWLTDQLDIDKNGLFSTFKPFLRH